MTLFLLKNNNNNLQYFSDGFWHLQQHLAHQVDLGLQENQQGPVVTD